MNVFEALRKQQPTEAGEWIGTPVPTVGAELFDLPRPGEPEVLVDWPTYMDPLKLAGSWAVASDPQSPHFSSLWAKRLAETADAHRIENLVVLGDVVNEDFASKFDKILDVPTYRQEKQQAIKLIEFLLGWFRRVVVVPGNHDLRLVKAENKAHDGKYRWQDFAEDWFPGAEFHPIPYQYCILNGQTRLTHPKNYSRFTTRVAQNLADTRFHMNVVVAHGHNMGITPSISGKYWCADSGGLFDEAQISYRMLEDSSYPAWCNGFLLIENIGGKDYPLLFNDLWHRWE